MKRSHLGISNLRNGCLAPRSCLSSFPKPRRLRLAISNRKHLRVPRSSEIHAQGAERQVSSKHQLGVLVGRRPDLPILALLKILRAFAIAFLIARPPALWLS